MKVAFEWEHLSPGLWCREYVNGSVAARIFKSSINPPRCSPIRPNAFNSYVSSLYSKHPREYCYFDNIDDAMKFADKSLKDDGVKFLPDHMKVLK
jgi:hypothetical protein